MVNDNLTLEYILELANFVSDVPLISLTDENAFEPLLALLFSDELVTDGETDATCCVIIASHLLSSGTPAIAPLLNFIKHEQEKTYGSVDEYIQFQKYRDDACEKIVGFIGDFGGDAVLSVLLEILHTSRRFQDSAIRTIVRLDTANATNQLMELLLNDKSEYRRIIIAEELINSKHPQAVSGLIMALKDVDTRVAITAATALGKIKSEVALSFLIEVITYFGSFGYTGNFLECLPYATIKAIYSYQTIQSKQVVFEWWVNNLKNSSNIEIRSLAAYWLGRLQDNRAIPYLVKSLDDNNWYELARQTISDTAQYALQEIGTPEALTAINNWQQNNP